MNKEVLLIYPPVYYQSREPEVLDVSMPPLGILYLAAVLEKENIPVKVIDVGALRQSLDQTLEVIEQTLPAVIGISAMTPQLQGAVSLAEAIKKRFAGQIKICLGGAHISSDPDFINRFNCFDLAILGESEKTFLRVVKDIFEGRPLNKLYTGEIVKDLDQLPSPARHLLPGNIYAKNASLIASRGCPFNCYYCSRPAVSNIVRYRSPVSIVDEMQSLFKACGGRYQFQDDAFTINRGSVIEICKEMISRKLNFRWSIYTRIDLIDEELLSLMAQAGCRTITFGIEAGNETIRGQIIGKKFSNQQVKDSLRLCRKYKIERGGFFMIGIPGETKDQARQTIDFMVKNDFNIAGLSIATPLPGSELWLAAQKAGIVNKSFIDGFARGQFGQGYCGVYPVYSDAGLPLDWLYQQRRSAMKRFYLRPKIIMNRLLEDFSSAGKLKEDLYQGLSILFKGSSSRSPYKKASRDIKHECV
jgi:radical SAM superfamily enzyme YgiQ (UPF0313 family)